MNISKTIEGINREKAMMLSDYERVKKHLFIRLSSRENAGPHSDLIRREVCDLALTCHIDMGHIEGGRANFPVRTGLLELLGVPAERIMDDAIANSPLIRPAEIISVDQMLMHLAGMDPGIPLEEQRRCQPDLYAVTVKDMYGGAAAVFYPGVLKQLALRLGGDLLLIPSSIHEFLACRDDGRIGWEGLGELIREINQTEVVKRDRLSDHPYRYELETDRILPA